MMRSKELGLALAISILCGAGVACDASADGKQAAHTGNQTSAKDGAVFRYVAREVYGAAASKSCGSGSVNYAEILAGEIAALRNFEASAETENIRFQLSLARADVELRGGSCWNDGGDPRFEERHIAFARENLTGGLATLLGLAPGLPSDAPDDSVPSNISAEFRARIEPLVSAVNPQCQLSRSGEDDAIIAPARLALDAFEGRLQGTPYALHFDIAEADVLYLQSVTMVECAAPRPTRLTVMSAEITDKMNAEIAAIEARSDFR